MHRYTLLTSVGFVQFDAKSDREAEIVAKTYPMADGSVQPLKRIG